MVCLNGNMTRIDIRTGKESVLDLTFVSNNLATICDWRVYKDGTIGSDHYPVICKINISIVEKIDGRGGNWVFGKADWEKFQVESEKYLSQVDNYIDIELLSNEVKQGILLAATDTIPRSKGIKRRKSVPWWNDNCKTAVKNRNKAFKLLKRTHNFQHMIQYKQAQAVVRRTIRQAKRIYWREFCSLIGSTTQIGEVWG